MYKTVKIIIFSFCFLNSLFLKNIFFYHKQNKISRKNNFNAIYYYSQNLKKIKYLISKHIIYTKIKKKYINYKNSYIDNFYKEIKIFNQFVLSFSNFYSGFENFSYFSII
jgi:hypothetical protein